jgi:hypothetical protein
MGLTNGIGMHEVVSLLPSASFLLGKALGSTGIFY